MQSIMRGQRIVYITNAVAFVGQAGTAIALLVLILTGRLSLQIPLVQESQQYFDDGSVVPISFDLGGLNPTWLLVAMCALTAANHALILVPPLFRVYYNLGRQGLHLFSWIEYSLTATLMLLVLLLLSGVRQLALAIAVASMIGFVNLLGGLVPQAIDWYTERVLPRPLVIWLPFAITTLLSLVPWAVILPYFWVGVVQSDAAVPIWLWFSFIGTFFNFNAFGFVFAGEYLSENSKWRWLRRNRWVWLFSYASLSLFSKLYLTWFFAGGILVRS